MADLKPVPIFTIPPILTEVPLEDVQDTALGLALRYRRQALAYRRLADQCERDAEYWERIANELRKS